MYEQPIADVGARQTAVAAECRRQVLLPIRPLKTFSWVSLDSLTLESEEFRAPLIGEPRAFQLPAIPEHEAACCMLGDRIAVSSS